MNGKRINIEQFIYGLGTLYATREDVVQAVGEELVAPLSVIAGKTTTTFAAHDADSVAAVDNLAAALDKYNKQVPIQYKITFSVSLAVPAVALTKKAELNDGFVRATITSCRGIPTTPKTDRVTHKKSLTTPTFWTIELALEVATGNLSFTAIKYGCKNNAEGLPEWVQIHRSEKNGGQLVAFTYEGEDAVDKVRQNTFVNLDYLERTIEEVKAEMPRDSWQKKLASHVLGRVVAVA